MAVFHHVGCGPFPILPQNGFTAVFSYSLVEGGFFFYFPAGLVFAQISPKPALERMPGPPRMRKKVDFFTFNEYAPRYRGTLAGLSLAWVADAS